MKNPYEYYFGKNIPRIIFLISCCILGFGGFNYAVGNSYGASIFCMIGVVPFFFTVHLQVTNKSIDDKVEKTRKEYAKKYIQGKTAGKRELAPAEFTAFSGYFWDKSGVRFKSCNDKKLRTSKYYVTAISLTTKECFVSTTEFNLLSEEAPQERFVAFDKGEEISFQTKEAEFPKSNFLCTLSAVNNGEIKEFCFYLPKGDYLAEQLIEKISEFCKDN